MRVDQAEQLEGTEQELKMKMKNVVVVESARPVGVGGEDFDLRVLG